MGCILPLQTRRKGSPSTPDQPRILDLGDHLSGGKVKQRLPEPLKASAFYICFQICWRHRPAARSFPARFTAHMSKWKWLREIQNLLSGGGIDPSHRLLPDQRRGGHVAKAEAGDLFDCVAAVSSGFSRSDLEIIAQHTQHVLPAGLLAARACANADDRRPHRLVIEHGIEIRNALNLCERNVKPLRDARHYRLGEMSIKLLCLKKNGDKLGSSIQRGSIEKWIQCLEIKRIRLVHMPSCPFRFTPRLRCISMFNALIAQSFTIIADFRIDRTCLLAIQSMPCFLKSGPSSTAAIASRDNWEKVAWVPFISH